MAEFPALPLWTDAYLSDTHPDLTLEEHGAYMLLLMAAWRRPDCAIPDDDKWICRFLGVHGNGWRKLRATVLERFFTRNEAGDFEQKRLRKERDFVEKTKRNQKEKSEKRWAKVRENKGIADAAGYAPTPTPTPTPIEEDKKDIPPSAPSAPAEERKPKSKPAGYSDEFERFWSIYPTHVQDGKADCWKLWKAALNRGESAEIILQHAEEYRRVWVGNQFRIGAKRYLRNDAWHSPVPMPNTSVVPFANAQPPAKSPINIHQRALERLGQLGFDDDDTGNGGGYLALAH